MTPRQKKVEAIINGSIELFNRSGVSEVTTNHIAEHLKISPGNLYYYFPNKEAIIREIFYRVREKIEGLWQHDDDAIFTLLTNYVHVVFHIIFGYRFFFSELSSILRRDPILQNEYIELQTRFKNELASFFLKLHQSGIFSSLAEVEKRMALADSVWIVSIYWHSYLETTPRTTVEAPTHKLLEHIVFLLTPYINSQYLSQIKDIFMSFVIDSHADDSC